MRTVAARPRRARRLCREQGPGRSRYSFVPGSVANQKRRAHLREGRGQLGTAHGRGGSSGHHSSFGGRGPAGVGRTWAAASAASPYSVRQPRADLVWSPDPPAGRGPNEGPPRSEASRARPASDHGGRMPGLRPRTPERARGPVTVGCHRCGWPHRLPLGSGSPAAPWLSASRSG
jgi:hypothetical protein